MTFQDLMDDYILQIIFKIHNSYIANIFINLR